MISRMPDWHDSASRIMHVASVSAKHSREPKQHRGIKHRSFQWQAQNYKAIQRRDIDDFGRRDNRVRLPIRLRIWAGRFGRRELAVCSENVLNGAIVPGFRFTFSYNADRVNNVTVYQVESLEFDPKLPPDAFVVSADAAVNVIDHRGGDLATRRPKSPA